MLEANDQGHNAQVFSKKKIFSQKSQLFREISDEEKKVMTLAHFSQICEVLFSAEDKAFSRTWGFEAKDLTFEANAKDFKMCPRGLHLW